jgi:hypothetical protein
MEKFQKTKLRLIFLSPNKTKYIKNTINTSRGCTTTIQFYHQRAETQNPILRICFLFSFNILVFIMRHYCNPFSITMSPNMFFGNTSTSFIWKVNNISNKPSSRSFRQSSVCVIVFPFNFFCCFRYLGSVIKQSAWNIPH